jgi:nucleoside-diphosphate-sugar epimerase
MVTDPAPRFKHVFVTGGTGIVGLPLCKRLASITTQTTVVSRSSSNHELPSGTNHVQADVLDFDAVAAAAQGADVIFHVAAAVHGSASSYAGFEQMNVDGTRNVIRVAREQGARLVHVSTVNVEGFVNGTLTDAYAETKARAERLVLDAVEDGLDAVIVRPATVFGNVSGRAGLIVDRLLSGSLLVLPAPSRMISPVWAGDLANALVRAADSGETGKIYTVAGAPVSTGEFVRTIAENADVAAPKITIPAWIIAIPLKGAWWVRKFTRWTPPVSVEAVRTGSVHDGRAAAEELGFSYTGTAEIFRLPSVDQNLD